MSSKSRRRNERHAVKSGTAAIQEVERLIAYRKLKEAVKQAKLCHRADGSPESRVLLERAYLLRSEQLNGERMPTAAREVVQHLLDFGITDPGVRESALRLLVSLGMADVALAFQGENASAETREQLVRQVADQAVLHPDRAAAAMPEVREGALRVRSALELLDRGDDAGALDALRDVARNSPFAEWRLFARGLAAFRRHDTTEASANWERLDPKRAPARIVSGLQSLTNPPGGGKAEVDSSALEINVFGQPVLEPLRTLRDHVTRGEWNDVLRLIVPMREKLARIDRRFAERMTNILYEPLIKAASECAYREAMSLIQRFTAAAEPLAIDPHWNRLRAMAWEGPHGDINEATGFWKAYLEDLGQSTVFKAEDRTHAQALVYKYLAKEWVDEGTDDDEPGPGSRRVDPEVRAARANAVKYLDTSLKLWPAHRETYEVLELAHLQWGQTEQATEVLRRVLGVFPEDFDALSKLAHHHFQPDDPVAALGYIQRARALKPLDEVTTRQEWSIRMALARHLAKQQQWDEGRAQFDAAAPLWPEESQWIHAKARRIVFEIKAGQVGSVQELLQEELDRLADPAPLWLALTIESRRYQAPKAEQERFEARWLNAVPKKVRGDTAGALSRIMGAFVGSDTSYPGRDEHVRDVLSYVKRTTRIKYTHDDLIYVCEFLRISPKQGELLAKMSARALKLFPNSPHSLLLAASLELQEGPFRADLTQARTQLEKALSLAQASSVPSAMRLIGPIKEMLSKLNALLSGPAGLPFGGFRGGPGGMPSLDDLYDMMEAMGLDPDELDDEFDDDFMETPAPTPARRPPAKRKRR